MNRLQVFIGAIFYLSAQAAAFAGGPILFVLERSTNRNQVVYQANLTPTGFDQNEPVHPSWKMLEKAGKTEELSGIEKSEAYGVHVSEYAPHEVTFTLSAMPKLPIVLRLGSGKNDIPHAYMSLNGSDIDLKHFFLHIEDGGLMPHLKLVDVSGRQGGHDVNFKLYIEKDDQIRVERAPRSSVYGQARFGTTRL